MEKSYVEITYSKREYSTAKTAIVAIQFEDGRLISESAVIAKAKLEEHIGETVDLLNYRYLGGNLLIID